MKTKQSLNTNSVNSAPSSSYFKEHYLQLISRKAIYISLKEEQDCQNYKRLIDQILFTYS